MEKIQRVENYIHTFFKTRISDFNDFYWNTHKERRYGILTLKRGDDLSGFLDTIHGTIEDNLFFGHLVPHKFATPAALFEFLNKFRDFLESKQILLDINIAGQSTPDIVVKIQEFKDEILQMIAYAKEIYDIDMSILPYQDLRYALLKRDVSTFIGILKSIHSSVSYAITKTAEGYYHSNVHLF